MRPLLACLSHCPTLRRALIGPAFAGAVGLLVACSTAPRQPTEPTPASTARVDTTDVQRLAQVRHELAAAYFERGQFETALGEVNQAIAARPDYAPAHALRGLIYAAQGDAVQADQGFAQALKLAPRDGNVMHNYGWFLCQQKRYSDADAQFAGALAEPSYREQPRTLLARGVCLARDERWADADRVLSQAFELDPGNPTVAVNLAEVLLHKGEYERARFYVRRVNSQETLASAQSLWLALRIERKLSQDVQVRVLGEQLRQRFGASAEAQAFEQGRFDD